jgi:microcystin-dependent protein
MDVDAYTGEIRMFGGTFAPEGWADCDGQLVPIEQYPQLFWLIGTTYGGDGSTTFALPDLRGRMPIGMQNNIGESAGTETVTLTTAMLPPHPHPAACGGDATTASPLNGYWARSKGDTVAEYTSKPPNAVMAAHAITPSGGGEPHANIQPYLCIRYIIARRTPRCSRCSARPTAATAPRRSVFRTCRAASGYTPAKARG